MWSIEPSMPHSDALLISMPFEIVIIEANGLSAYLAQVEYAEADWSFSEVSIKDFSNDKFQYHIPFSSRGDTYTLFDAAYLPSEIGDDCLSFSLAAGNYTLSATYNADQVKGLFLYKIEPANLAS